MRTIDPVPARHTGRVLFVTAGDPSDPDSYSSLPFGLHGALVRAGVQVDVLRLRLPSPVDRALPYLLWPPELRTHGARDAREAWWLARQRVPHGSARMQLIAAVTARTARRRARGGIGVIQHGTEVDLGSLGVPLVTYEDSTVVGALRVREHYAHLQRATQQSLDAAVARSARVYARATACCFVSHWAARSAVEDYGVPAARVRVVGQGRNREPLTSLSRDWRRPTFLWVGKEWERKGGERTLRAFVELRHQVPSASLHLVGRHPPVDVAGVVGHGLLDVRSPQAQRHLDELFSGATCFVMPSAHEPAGTVFVEAAAGGVGSIAGTSGGSATMVGDGGILVPDGDDHALLQAMRRFCDPTTAEALGAAARQRADLLTWDAVACRLLQALHPGSATIPADLL